MGPPRAACLSYPPGWVVSPQLSRPCFASRGNAVRVATVSLVTPPEIKVQRGVFVDNMPRYHTRLPVRFTGTGAGYFRIWIVNLILTALTLGLYWPFAKVRKRRFFYENTWVGDAPLGFDGNPKVMLRGHVLVSVMFVLWVVAQSIYGESARGLLVLLVPFLPWLMWSSLRFRTGHTLWRGLRFQFDGSLKDLYRVFAPLAWLLLSAVVLAVAALALGSVQPWVPMLFLIGALGLLVVLLIQAFRLGWRFKGYQHGHYRLGAEVTRLSVSLKDYQNLETRISLMTILVLVGAGVVATLITVVTGGLGAVPSSLLLYATALVMMTYRPARLQDLLWNNTRSEHIRFNSALPANALLKLLMKNAVLTAVTLGLYWPFAAVAQTRMRLEAFSVDLYLSLEELTGASAGPAGTLGDAAADISPLGVEVDF